MWKNGSVQKCKAVYDILGKINNHAGVTLPDGKSMNELIGTTVNEILDFGQRVFDDNELWDKVPVEFVDLKSIPINRDDLRKNLKKLLDDSV